MSPRLNFDFDFSNAFSKVQPKTPIFLRSRGVAGHLSISGASSNDVTIVKIVLKGALLNIVSQDSPGYYASYNLALEQTVCSLTEVCDIRTSSRNVTARDGLRIPFAFHLQKTSSYETRPIPSSMSIVSKQYLENGTSTFHGETSIKYSLHVYAFHDHDVAGTATRNIQLYDSMPASPPPLCIEHFPGEYRLKREGKLSKKLSLATSNLTIKTSEPKPLAIREGSESPMVKLPIRLKIKNASRGPGPCDIRVTWAVKSHTFISVKKTDTAPTSSDAKRNPFTKEVVENGSPTKTKLKITNWKPTSSPGEWKGSADLWIPVLGSDLPPPTFFTPYLSHRYSISTYLDVCSGALGSTTLDLRVPLQITYDMGDEPPSFERTISECGTDFQMRQLAGDFLRTSIDDDPLPPYVQ